MTDFPQLLNAAYKAERSASRRLALRSGIPEERALREILVAKAGAGGLAALLDQRQAGQAALAARAAERDARRALQRHQRATRHEAPAGTWRAWFDGSAKPNPGRCSIGAVLTGPAGERTAIAREVGYGNSSEAEYLALIAVLEAGVALGVAGLTVHGDSRVVIDDMESPAAAASPALREYRQQAHALLAQLEGASLRWIPRHKNGAADTLAARAAAGATHEVR